MDVEAELCRLEAQPLRRVAGWRPGWVRQCMPAVAEAAEQTRLWWAVAAVLAGRGVRGKRAALAGLAAMAAAETVSNAVVKPLLQRRRPPEHLVPLDDVQDRPDSPSFPSGHTAAAAGFTAAVARVWPAAGALCATAAGAVAVQRVHSGAHYPSDVVAGAAIGVATAESVRRLPRHVHRLIW
jgi:undecaprenyl-diphosphatase